MMGGFIISPIQYSLGMQKQCGQCNKPFSGLCGLKTDCPLHNGSCFSCKDCTNKKEGYEQYIEYRECDLCLRSSKKDELYYEFHCNQHICQIHFLKLDLTQAQTTLPCGDQELTQHVINYMRTYCAHCGRKLKNACKNRLGICMLCKRKGFSLAKQEYGGNRQDVQKQDAAPIKKESQKKESQLQQQQQPVSQEEQLQKYKKLQQQSLRQQQSLKNELLLLNQMLKVSQFTRDQIKEAINHTERDQDCIICLESFNLTDKKPIMVCIQQHLVCQKCIQEQGSLQNCPLCRDEIDRSKVLPCRERIKTIELENIVSEKYETKLRKFLQKISKQSDEGSYDQKAATTLNQMVQTQVKESGEKKEQRRDRSRQRWNPKARKRVIDNIEHELGSKRQKKR